MPLDPSIITGVKAPDINIPAAVQSGLQIQNQRILNQAAQQQIENAQTNNALTQQQTQNAQTEGQLSQLKVHAATADLIGNYLANTDKDNYEKRLNYLKTLNIPGTENAPPTWEAGGKDFTQQATSTNNAISSKLDLQKKALEVGQLGMLTGQSVPNQGAPNEAQGSQQPNSPAASGITPNHLDEAQSPTEELPVGSEVSSAHGGAPLQQLGPVAIRAQKMIDGTEPILGMTSTRDPIGYAAAMQARAIKPNIDTNAYDLRKDAVENYSSKGKAGQSYITLNTIAGHIDEMAKHYEALHNKSDSAYFAAAQNYVRNKYNEGQKAGPIRNFDITNNKLSDEFNKLYVPGGGSAGEREEGAAEMRMSDSPETAKAALSANADLAISKMDALETARRADFGKSIPPNKLVNKDTLQTLAKYASPEGIKTLQKYGYTPPAQERVRVASEPAPPGSANANLIEQVTGKPVVGGMAPIPTPAAQYLLKNPETAAHFDAKYGTGASKMVLGK